MVILEALGPFVSSVIGGVVLAAVTPSLNAYSTSHGHSASTNTMSSKLTPKPTGAADQEGGSSPLRYQFACDSLNLKIESGGVPRLR